uniref:VWFA domain-containing protein n=1 Tax=Ciona intestinalis TaxID=7719 RepID=F6SEY1_CIOIN
FSPAKHEVIVLKVIKLNHKLNYFLIPSCNLRYGNLTIWIGPEVPENFELVTKLQELITKTSSTLFRLTKKRAYIRNVIIAIPKTWGTPPESFNQSISGKLSRSQTSAQIWVRNSSPSDPYVIKTTPCGFPGAYLRLSPEFVLFGEDMTEMRGAAPEKIVSREWAKLRWGTFDEKARAEDTTKFYLHSDRSIFLHLSLPITGDVVNQSSPRSPCNEKQRLFDNSCVFVPSKQPQEKTYASLLYRADLPYVNDFCDNGDDVTPEMKHDEEAPTVHNLHCKGRSIWAVIREHPDFKDGNNPPMESDEPPALPNFTLLKGFDRRIVLVLDISTSMENYGRMGLMRQAVSNFIDTVPMNTWVGIVVFASRANTLARLTEITSYDARNILKTRLVNTTVQGTSIGSGIMKGLEVLETSGPRSLRGSGGSIIILTDGLEHNNPKINDTIERVREFGVRVSTIALGSNVAKDLEWLASVSNGRTHAASSGQFGIDAELQEAFASHHEQEDNFSVGSISILSQEVVIEKNSTVEKVFLIDSSIGENTRVAVFYQQKPAPLIAIKTPQNETFFQHEHTERFFFTHDESFQIKTIRIQGNAQVGTWAVVLENEMESTDMRVQVSVTSYQRQTEPLVISPALLCRSFAFTGHEAVVIYANLKQGEHAVLNAYVGAEITRPLSTSGIVDTKFIELKDNGLDPDVTADDGVYSAYFTSFTMQGRYNVKVTVI